MPGILVAAVGLVALTAFTYLSVVVVKKATKPVIDELREPSKDIVDFANQGNLDEYQKKALLSKFKQTLVMAGAGAGKTKILTERIVLFAKFLKIPISNMLVMAFNKAAAKEVIDRVAAVTGDYPYSLKDNIRTIHSFALDIARGENPKLELVTKDKEKRNLIKQALNKYKSGATQSVYMGKVVNLFGNLEPKENINKHKNVPEPGKKIRCSDGTLVRSKAEKRIVEKLIENNIRFEYEPMVAWADMYFEPDFFFPDYMVYAEYWGMMYHENEKIRERYCAQMKWKQEQFKKYKYYWIDIKPNVNENEQPPEDSLISKLKKFKTHQFTAAYHNKIKKIFNAIEDKFVELIIAVMDITMAYGIKLKDLIPKADPFVKAVLRFIIPICEDLEMSIELKNKATFTMVLNKAVKRLRKDKQLGKSIQEKYKCIFIDEVQDLQPLTRRFIRLLTGKEQNLFAIGDDYQSIYSFTGSDPMFIVKFEHYFPEAEVMQLKYNYRCHPNIVEISNRIIRNNKHQRFKQVIGKFCDGQSETDKVLTVVTVSDEVPKETLADYLLSQIPDKEDIQILGRYKETMPIIQPYMSVINHKFKGRKMKYRTIHKSKGLQSDNVIILGCVDNQDGAYCFPAKDNFQRIKDKILRLCRCNNKFNLVEEETRLFYVAVTRAKKRVFVVTVKGRESKFVDKKFLPRDLIHETAMCPKMNTVA
ncbi:MAG TPA: hypothetical protein ENN45_04430 [Bacteroidetes bacterium]|nr:hypothetical protein [Bacteroidota bacterium]